MASRFSVSTVFEIEDKMSSQLEKMARSVTRFERKIERSFNNVNKSLETTGRLIEKGITQTKTLGVTSAAAVGGIVAVGAEFEQQMVDAGARFSVMIEKGTEGFRRMSDEAKRVGETTEYSATQAGQAIEYMAAGGFSPELAISALKEVVDFATASKLGLGEAAKMAIDTVGLFGLKIDGDDEQSLMNFKMVMDSLTYSAKSVNATVTEIFEGFKDPGPIMSKYEDGFHTVNALVTALGSVGLKGPEVSTAIRGIVLRLKTATGDAAALLHRFNIQVEDKSTGLMRNPIKIIQELNDALAGLGDIKASSVLKAIFDEEPISSLESFLKLNKALDLYFQASKKAAGTYERTSDIRRDTLSMDLKALSSSIQAVAISLYELDTSGMRSVILRITEFVRTINQAITQNREFAISLLEDTVSAVMDLAKAFIYLIGIYIALKVAIVAVVAVMLTLKTIFLVVKAAILTVIVVFKALGLIISVFLAIISLPISAMATLAQVFVAAAVLIITKWEFFSEFFSSLWEWIVEAFESGVDSVMSVLEPFKKAIDSVKGLWDKLKSAVSDPIKAEVTMEQNTVTSASAGVSNPSASIVSSLYEGRSSAEITIRNESGTTAVVSRRTGDLGIMIEDSGAFS